MSILEEKLTESLSSTVLKHNMVIDELNYKKKGKDYVLEVFVEREDLSSIELDDIVKLSEDLSAKLDEINLIQDNYCLDVSTSGTEKPIKDFSKFNLLIGKYMEIRLINPVKGCNIFEGTLEAVEGDSIILACRDKTRTIKFEFNVDNISKAKLTAKL